MEGFVSKYSGTEIEDILDKVESIEVNSGEDVEMVMYLNTLTINGATYKVPTEKQSGMYSHTVRGRIYTPSNYDDDAISINGGSNEIVLTVYNTDNTRLSFNDIIRINRSLFFSNIEYNKNLNPVTIYNALMTEVMVNDKLRFCYSDSPTTIFNNFIEFEIILSADEIHAIGFN